MMAVDRPQTWTEVQTRLLTAHSTQRLHVVFTADNVYRCVVAELRNGMVTLISRERHGLWETCTLRCDDVVAVEQVPPAAPSTGGAA